MSDLLQKFNDKKIQEYKKDTCDFTSFRVGDTVNVGVLISEGTTTRTQYFQGTCIGKVNRGVASSFAVRKLTTSGDAVEKQFKIYLRIWNGLIGINQRALDIKKVLIS
jgi:ribosomal protein L19